MKRRYNNYQSIFLLFFQASNKYELLFIGITLKNC